MKREARKIITQLVCDYKVKLELLAFHLGVSYTTMYRWWKGKTSPSYAELRLLREILGRYQASANTDEKKS